MMASLASRIDTPDTSFNCSSEDEFVKIEKDKNNRKQTLQIDTANGVDEKEKKEQVLIGMFNDSPRKTIKFIKDRGLIQSAEEVATFLLRAPGLDPHKVGTLLGEPDDYSISTLYAYAQSFPMLNVPLDIALRLFLGRFWIPGEAQKIDRVLGAFADAYYHQNVKNSNYKSADTVHILAFSAVLLNTDAHNPNILRRRRMSKADFIRNHRGLDAGGDIPVDVLSGIYDTFHRHPLGLFRSKELHLSVGEVDVTFGEGQIGLQLETDVDGISVVVKKYQEKGSAKWLNKKQDIEDWIVLAIGEHSTVGLGFSVTMWMLKLASRPVTVLVVTTTSDTFIMVMLSLYRLKGGMVGLVIIAVVDRL